MAGDDQTNLLCSLIAKQLGIPKVVTGVSQDTSSALFERVGIDVTLNARAAAIAEVLHQIQAPRLQYRATLEAGRAEVVEVAVPPDFETTRLREMDMPTGVIVGAVLRQYNTIVPGGDDEVRAGDRLLVVATPEARGDRGSGLRSDARLLVAPPVRVSLVLRTTLALVGCFGAVLLAPSVVEAAYGHSRSAIAFLGAALLAILLGLGSRLLPGRGLEMRRMEGLATVAVAWLLLVLIGAIPYSANGFAPADALFESMSGLTGTGATILTDFDAVSEGIFLWRSLSEWVGSMGIIALFIAVLPALRIAGRQMFFAEAPGPTEERLTPRIRNTALYLYSFYVGLTALEIGLLIRFGMPPFDAVCNSLSTVSAGGFSPNPSSIGGYSSSLIEWTVMAFMLLAGANYAFQFQVVRGRPLTLLRSEEFRLYVLIVICATLLLALHAEERRRAAVGVDRHGRPVGGDAEARRLPGAGDHHDDRIRDRGLRALGPGESDDPSAAHVLRRLRRFSSRRPEARAGMADRKVDPARTVPDRRSAGRAAAAPGRPPSARRRDPRRRVLPAPLPRAVRAERRRGGAGRHRHAHRGDRQHRDAGQHRPGPGRRRPVRQLRPLPRCDQGLPVAQHVDRPARDHHRPDLPAPRRLAGNSAGGSAATVRAPWNSSPPATP